MKAERHAKGRKLWTTWTEQAEEPGETSEHRKRAPIQDDHGLEPDVEEYERETTPDVLEMMSGRER